MKASILIAFKHPEIENNVIKVIDSINAVLDSFDDYEILTYGPITIDKPKVRSLIQSAEDQKGSIQAYNHLVENASGDYIIAAIDDSILHPNWPSVINFIENDLKDRRFKLTALMHPNEPNGCINTYKNINFPIVRHPCFHKSLLEHLPENKLAHPRFINHVADNFLGFYCQINGQWIEECKTANYHVLQVFPYDATHDKEDLKTFGELADFYLKGIK